MKKNKVIIALLAVICALAFSACGAAFDPVAYVDGTLQATIYGNVTDDYVAMLADEDSATEMKEEYDEFLEDYSELIIAGMGITEPGATLTQDTLDMLINVYNHTKYEVTGEYTEGENGEYYVEVIVYPLVTFNKIVNDEDGSLSAALVDKYSPDMTYEELITLSLECMIEAMNTALENPEYGDAITFDIEVAPDDDGYYVVNDDQIEELDYALLDMQ